MTEKTNLLNFNLEQLKSYFVELDEKSFRAQQIFQWIHQYGVIDFDVMTNLSKSLREKLKQCARIAVPELLSEHRSSDGTVKWLLKLDCGNCIETVYIPENNRGTLCVSSQVGCVLTCSFCSTAKQGFNRDLSISEIISQVWIAVRKLSEQSGRHDRHVTNVVMMGMGEPLLNFDNVVAAMDIMLDDLAYGLSKYRVTLSTSGVVPNLERLQQISPVALAVSLHAANDTLRNQLVPINRKYPLNQLMALCKRYFPKGSKRKITFEYVMIKGINDSLEQAAELAQLLHDVPTKLNLIPFNPFPGTDYQRSSNNQIERFKSFLLSKGYNVTVRKTRGEDIDAACGQLAGKVNDKTSRSSRWQKIQIHRAEKDSHREV